MHMTGAIFRLLYGEEKFDAAIKRHQERSDRGVPVFHRPLEATDGVCTELTIEEGRQALARAVTRTYELAPTPIDPDNIILF